MPYTVYRPDGHTKDEFQTYVRLLRQSGIDIGKLSRVPDPIRGRNWVYVWEERKKAEEFLRELSEQVADGSLWKVEEVSEQPSEGPFGPIRIRMIREREQVVFTLDLLSRHLIRSAYPQAIGIPTLGMAGSTFKELQKVYGGDFFPRVVQTLLPALTGLTPEQIKNVGYEVIDADTHQPLDYTPPSDLSAA